MGINLAWTCDGSHNTGIAIIEEIGETLPRIISTSLATDNNDIISKWDEHKPDFISIDAPLIVQNEMGLRYCENRLNELYFPFGALALPTSRTFLEENYGGIRGEMIADLLIQQHGFVHYPNSNNEGRWVSEVCPRAASIVLFELKRVIRYGRGPIQLVRTNLANYRKHILQLFVLNAESEHIQQVDINELHGIGLKDFERRLVALTCAYIAYFTHSNPHNVKIYGDSQNGYIVNPTLS